MSAAVMESPPEAAPLTLVEPVVTRPLLDPHRCLAAFYGDLKRIASRDIYMCAIEVLRRGTLRYLTGPSSSTGKYHPKDEFIAGPPGDPTNCPVSRNSEFGGQTLHVRRVAALCREFCRAHEWHQGSIEWDLLHAAAVTHDVAQWADGNKWTVKYHEALVRPLTDDIPALYPQLRGVWEQLMRLCEVHSGIWGKTRDLVPANELEWAIHTADMLASRRTFGEFDPSGGAD